MWNGGKDSGAVSGVIVTGTGATMVHRNGKTLGIANYLMGTTTIYGNYETDTTSFLFKLRVVQALFWRTLPRFSHLTTATKKYIFQAVYFQLKVLINYRLYHSLCIYGFASCVNFYDTIVN
jgi:hypothetical protein